MDSNSRRIVEKANLNKNIYERQQEYLQKSSKKKAELRNALRPNFVPSFNKSKNKGSAQKPVSSLKKEVPKGSSHVVAQEVRPFEVDLDSHQELLDHTDLMNMISYCGTNYVLDLNTIQELLQKVENGSSALPKPS